MAATVFLIGAGANRCIEGWHGRRPPLAKDFFIEALMDPSTGDQLYEKRIHLLLSYILRNWGLSSADLRAKPFDLEECFTKIENDMVDARAKGDVALLSDLQEVRFQVTSLLASTPCTS